jgi:CBS domain-containing protein
MDATVKQLMTPYPVVVDAATPLMQCARLMADRDIGALGVVREGRLAGVLTDRDIVVRSLARGDDPAQQTALETASRDVVSVTPDASVDEAEQRMRGAAVRRLFVVADDGRPIGILTLDDIVAVREPESIVAYQIREWSIARSDMGLTGGDD